MFMPRGNGYVPRGTGSYADLFKDEESTTTTAAGSMTFVIQVPPKPIRQHSGPMWVRLWKRRAV